MISSLGYLRIESADVSAWREFGVEILGLTEGRGPEAEAVYLRMDDFPARLVILPGSSERLLASGWEVADTAALAAVGRALADAGVAYKPGTADEAAARRVGSMLRVDDPAGHTLEVFRFLGCNPRHHSLALVPMPAAAGLVHLMIEVASLDDVGRALDRCARRGAPVSGTLGRHANDHMVSFYVRTPAGSTSSTAPAAAWSTTRPGSPGKPPRSACGGTALPAPRTEAEPGTEAARFRQVFDPLLGQVPDGHALISLIVAATGRPDGFQAGLKP